MQREKQNNGVSKWLLGIGLLMLTAGLLMLWLQPPPVDAADSTGSALVAPGCMLQQTIDYASCGHQVLRRVDAPAMWTGMTKETVVKAMEEGWRMTGFGAGQIDMTCSLGLFCPQHWVLTLAEDGTPGVYRNRYGFGMERMDEVSLKITDEPMREMVERGIPFDTREELDAWIDANAAMAAEHRTGTFTQA